MKTTFFLLFVGVSSALADSQAFDSLKAFVKSGRQSDFIGLSSEGPCGVHFSDAFGPLDTEVGALRTDSSQDALNTVKEFFQTPATLHLHYVGTRTERDSRDITFDLSKNADGQLTSVALKIVYVYPNAGSQQLALCEHLKPVTTSCSVKAEDNFQADFCPGVKQEERNATCSATCRAGQSPDCTAFICGTDDRGNVIGINNTEASCACQGMIW